MFVIILILLCIQSFMHYTSKFNCLSSNCIIIGFLTIYNVPSLYFFFNGISSLTLQSPPSFSFKSLVFSYKKQSIIDTIETSLRYMYSTISTPCCNLAATHDFFCKTKCPFEGSHRCTLVGPCSALFPIKWLGQEGPESGQGEPVMPDKGQWVLWPPTGPSSVI